MTNPLARTIMGNNLKGNQRENYNKTHNNHIKSDVDEDYTKLINDLIQGEKKVVEGTSVNKKITLEEAVDRVRKGL